MERVEIVVAHCEPANVRVGAADGKQAVNDLVTGAGLQALDAGTQRRAGGLVVLGFLQITVAPVASCRGPAGSPPPADPA